MDCPGTRIWTWTLCVLLIWICGVLATPTRYVVVIPAVLEAGAEAHISALLIEPKETLLTTITLRTKQQNLTLLVERCNLDFFNIYTFQVPSGLNDAVAYLEVEIRGVTFYSKEVRKVLIRTYEPLTFVQTDKPLYLPGQTVNFRVVTMDTEFIPVTQLYNTIYIEDPNGNKIGQWLNKTSDGKILQLSYSFNSEAREGSYTIIVTFGKNKLFQRFKVEKYVLPKFDVNIEASDEVSIGQKKIYAKVCSQYTFKQPVPGNIEVEICRPLRRFGPFRDAEEIKPPCVVKTIELDNLGCATFVFEMSAFKRLDHKVVQNYLVLKAKVEEEGTGITYQQEKRIRISLVIGKLTFIDTPKTFERGSIVTGKIKAVNYNDVPISNLKVYLFGESLSVEVKVQVLTTNSDGIAVFLYNTANSKSEIQLRADIRPDRRRPLIALGEGYIEPGYIQLSLVQVAPKTVSSLEVQKKEGPIPCQTEEDISIKYTIVGETQGSATVVWIVLGRGDIVTHGSAKIEVQYQTVAEGEISFKIRVIPQMSPHIQIVVYAVLPSEKVIANSADFSTEKCFSHQVSVEFSPSTSVPGEKNTLKFTALPFSLCGVSAVDKSVLIKEPGKTLDINRIFALLPVTKSFYFPSEIEDPQDCVVCRQKRFILPHPGRDDPYTVFKKVGLKVATNLDIRIPSCLKYGGRQFIYSERGIGFPRPVRLLARAEASEGALLPPIATVRTFFPETWIWDLVEIGNEGTSTVTLTVPDTITTWETEVFCLSPMGLGLAPRKELTVFQPFFLELSLPYSIIRGENFELKATVFNYLSSCIMITVTAAPSSEYRLVPKFGVEYTTCLCVNERKTVSWTLIPSALGDLTVSVTAETVVSSIRCNNEVVIVPVRGRSDTVSRTLKVKAEGIKKIVTSNLLLLPKDEALTEIVVIQRPENEIVGSGRYLISVLGDIMGRALNNLDDQLRLPYGCGEQNIARLAPNIYILQYLEVTKQLTPDIKTKGINFLISGYQRQLNYRNPDGAFNTFGSGTGNTWLTAFVIRSFVKAQNFIFIDPKVINDAKTWLLNTQKNNGCFEQLGKIFHNRMKGGVSDDVTITAYVTAALLESKSTVTDSITKSLLFLKKSLNKFENTYTKALQAYVFTLAGDMATRTLLLSQLDSVAIKERGLTHWEQTATDTSLSLSVEMTSYVLLALLSATPSREELGYAASIVRWLTRQQNFYGGFSSTQDTVAALQALALYSTRVFNSEGSSTVKITTSSGMLNFEVNRNNKLLYQEQLLLVQTGTFTVKVEGSAFVLVQISYLYNIPAISQGTTLEVELSTTCKSSTRPKMTLTMKCLYTGKQPTTNMVILDITILSGFAPCQLSLKKLEEEVERIESKVDQLLVYIKELSFNTPIQYELDLIQEFSVINLQSAAVKIYDYYQPSDQDEACYNNPCMYGKDR